MSFIIEGVYPKGPIVVPKIDFKMVVQGGSYERQKTGEEHRKDLEDLELIPDDELVWFVAAMHRRRNPQTMQMFKEDRELIMVGEKVCTEVGLKPRHSFGLQDFGKVGVTDIQATERDEPSTRRSRVVLAYSTTVESPNASLETAYRLSLGRPLIAAVSNDNLGQRFRDWLEPLIEAAPATGVPSLLITYDSLTDFARGFKRAIVYS